MSRPDTEGERRGLIAALVAGLRAQGINDERVLGAVAAVPRDRFVPDAALGLAWANEAVPIGLGQTISQPFVVALMTAALALSGHEQVLEIGTGSAYQTAILARLAAHVTSIERHAELALRARRLLDALGIGNVSVHVGDGTLGYPPNAPFDRIVVTAGAPTVPDPLLQQLSVDRGRMVIPVGGPGGQQLTVIERRGELLREERIGGVRFVPLIGRAGWAETGDPGGSG